MKKCKKCNIDKELNRFFKDAKMPDGHRNDCKDCKQKATYEWRAKNVDRYNDLAQAWRKRNPEKLYERELKRNYGCSLEQYNQMVIDQKGKCAICSTLHNPMAKKGRLFVDHDHKTGKIRALLCSACNCMLGYAKDNINTLVAAIEYIKKHS